MDKKVERKDLYEELLLNLVIQIKQLHAHLINLHGSKGSVDDLIEIFNFIGVQNLDKAKFTNLLMKLNPKYVCQDSSKLSQQELKNLIRSSLESMIRNKELCENIFEILNQEKGTHLEKARLEFNLNALGSGKKLNERILNHFRNEELSLNLTKTNDNQPLIIKSEEQIDAFKFDLVKLNKIDDSKSRQTMFLLLNGLCCIFFVYLFIRHFLFFYFGY